MTDNEKWQMCLFCDRYRLSVSVSRYRFLEDALASYMEYAKEAGFLNCVVGVSSPEFPLLIMEPVVHVKMMVAVLFS